MRSSRRAGGSRRLDAELELEAAHSDEQPSSVSTHQELLIAQEASKLDEQVKFLKDGKLPTLQNTQEQARAWTERASELRYQNGNVTTKALLRYVAQPVQLTLSWAPDCEKELKSTVPEDWNKLDALVFLQGLKRLLGTAVGQDKGVLVKPDELIAKLHRDTAPEMERWDGSDVNTMFTWIARHNELISQSEAAEQFAKLDERGELVQMVIKSTKKHLQYSLISIAHKDIAEVESTTIEEMGSWRFAAWGSKMLAQAQRYAKMRQDVARLELLMARAREEKVAGKKRSTTDDGKQELPLKKVKQTQKPMGEPPQPCKVCGGTHKGSNCRDFFHPDANHTAKAWADSEKGSLWKKAGKDALDFRYKLSAGGSLVTYEATEREADRAREKRKRQTAKESKCLQCMQVEFPVADSSNAETTNAHPTCRIAVEDRFLKSQLRIRTGQARLVDLDVSLLIDTGALNVNTCNRRTRDRILAAGGKVESCRQRIRVGGGEMIAYESIQACIVVENARVWSTSRTCGVFFVVDGTADVIVGRPMLDKSIQLKRVLFGQLVSAEDIEWMAEELETLQLQSKKQGPVKESEPERGEVEPEATVELNATEAVAGETPTLIEGSPEQIATLEALVREFSDCFSRKLLKEAARVPPMHLTVDKAQWERRENQRPPRPRSQEQQREIDRQTDDMQDAEVVRLSQAGAHSQVLLVRKPDGSWRFCIDYRRLNEATKAETWPIPNIPRMLSRIGATKPRYFGVLDLTKGYYQTPLAEGSAKYTAFITSSGLYEWRRVPMGLKGAPGYFQRTMTMLVLAGLVGVICEVYMDDVIVYGKDFEEYVLNLRRVLERLRRFRLTANPDKTRLGLERVEYVGHIIDSTGITFSPERIREIADFPLPATKGELKSFLGLANYVRDSTVDASEFTVPLTAMLNGYSKKQRAHRIVWTPDQLNAWKQYKVVVNQSQKLFYADETSPIHLYTDASNVGIGAL